MFQLFLQSQSITFLELIGGKLRYPDWEVKISRFKKCFCTIQSAIMTEWDCIEWLVSECTISDTPIGEILEAEAIELLATRLLTPLQIEQHLTLALEAAYRVSRG